MKESGQLCAVSLCVALLFAVNAVLTSIVFAKEHEVFLSLTKSEVDIENLPTNVTIITKEEIEEKHIKNLAELLENEVGLFYKTNGNVGGTPTVFVRGVAGAARTLLLIDGRKVNSADSGSANFTSMPASMIERVEIIRGSGSSVYGTGSFGGVINVITKTAKEHTQTNVGTFFGSDGTFKPYAVLPYYSDKINVLFAGSVYQTDGYRKNSQYKDSNILFNGSVNITENSSLSLSANSYDADFSYPGSTIYNDFGRQRDHNEYIKADYKLNLTNAEIRTSVYNSKNVGFNDSSWGGAKSTNKVLGVQGEIFWNDILFGIECYQDSYKNENTGISGVVDGTPTIDKKRETIATYAQYVFSPIALLRFIPSVRYDNNSAYGNVFTPSISVIANLTENFKISANSGKVWRAPTFADLYYPGFANSDLKPEEGISSDLGFEFTKSNIKTAVTGFFIDSSNLIILDNTWTPQNIGKAQQCGVEFSLGFIMTSWLTHETNYTYLESKNKSTNYYGKSIYYSPKNTVNYSLILKPYKTVSFSAILNYRDKYYTDEANTKEIKDIITVDTSLNYNAAKGINVWLKVSNITNEKYEIVDGYPMPRAALQIGIDAKFDR
ncbi:MAG: TonB-dependent receptor [Elusimicrobiota bacterium]|jgi:outer membrane cobalamin receptor|nr:TonB-dependent receptor [Elusimicrobiota bacterium]